MGHSPCRSLCRPILVAALLTLAGACQAAMVGNWGMNEGSGQTVGDATANNNDGTLGDDSSGETDDPTWNTSIPASGSACLVFSRDDDDWVRVLDADSLDISGASAGVHLACYIYPLNGSATSQMLIWKGTSTLVNYYLEMRVFGFGNYGIRFGLKDSNGGNHSLDYQSSVSLGGWQYVWATYDSGDDTGDNCIIGVGAGTTSGTIDLGSYTMAANSGNLCIGRQPASNGFDGAMDEVKVYELEPLPVEVAGLKAARSGNLWRIVWEALGLPDIMGYNILRRDPQSPDWTRANATMISADGETMGHAKLAFADGEGDERAEYKLEAVTADGCARVYEVPRVEEPRGDSRVPRKGMGTAEAEGQAQ